MCLTELGSTQLCPELPSPDVDLQWRGGVSLAYADSRGDVSSPVLPAEIILFSASFFLTKKPNIPVAIAIRPKGSTKSHRNCLFSHC